MDTIQFKPLGESAVTVVLGDDISEETHKTVTQFDALLRRRDFAGVVETVPTYCSVTVHYLPYVISYDRLIACLQEVADAHDAQEETPCMVVEIPVAYGGKFGPDMDAVAAHCGLTPDQVVARHSDRDYLIYMLGFTPGFPYLGGMDESLSTPRLTVPRTKIEAGSVGIAGSQTGVYSVASPGGWQLIGRTPVHLYHAEFEPHILLKSGDYIRFVPIDEREFDRISALADRGEYQCTTYRKAVRV